MQLQGHESKNILVAEDDEATRRTLATLLGAAGYTVTSAANGQEALDCLRRQPPDLILLDLTMPVLDGWQFLNARRQDPSLLSIPVIVVSGSAGAERQVVPLGVEELLHKPVELDRLLGTIGRFTTRQKPGVLVVDDEAAIRKILQITLSRHGFTVWTAAGGREALAVYREHQGSIGLILLDVRMPDMDGPQTLAAIREIDPHARAAFMSGNTGSYTPEELSQMGAEGMFEKPFSSLDGIARALLQTVQEG